MARKQVSGKTRAAKTETDSAFVLKLVLYAVLGMQWLFIVPDSNIEFPLPIGAVLGIIFASHDHFSIDRKIEYAVLLIAMLIGFFAYIGITIKI